MRLLVRIVQTQPLAGRVRGAHSLTGAAPAPAMRSYKTPGVAPNLQSFTLTPLHGVRVVERRNWQAHVHGGGRVQRRVSLVGRVCPHHASWPRSCCWYDYALITRELCLAHPARVAASSALGLWLSVRARGHRWHRARPCGYSELPLASWRDPRFAAARRCRSCAAHHKCCSRLQSPCSWR